MQAGHTTRLRIGIASLVVLAVAATMAAFSAGAAAGGNGDGFTTFDPQQINVPYLAWRGEEVRLVKCFPGLPPGQGGAFGAPAGKFIVEDWSGDPHFQPQMANGLANTTTFFDGVGDQEGRTCFSADFLSQKAGLAIIKLKVHLSELVSPGPGPLPGGGEDQVVAEHQFLVGWMRILQANVEDIGPTTVPASRAAINYWNPQNGPVQQVVGKCNIQVGGGVIHGNCPTIADETTTAASQNQIQVTITGEIPMMNNFDEVNAQLGRAAGTPLIMPRDWAALAGVMARSSLPGHERTPALWDIHDEFTGVPGGAVAPPAGHGTGWTEAQPNVNAGPTHQSGGICQGSSDTMDEVDNCLGGGEFGATVDDNPEGGTRGGFSRFLYPWVYGGFSDMTDVTIGPYDPLREDTYLPNGTLDEGDAPMPTARIDFNLNGVGMLLPIDKHVVYSRNSAGTPTTVDPDPDVEGDEFIDYPGNAHNLWAPFYGRWIPATQAREGASTTTHGTLLPEFVPPTTASGEDGGAANDFHSYLVRGVYHYWDFAVALERDGALFDCPPFTPGIPASDAFGIFQAAVYTDEHGEARVGFNAGVGFPVLNITANENGACDLQARGIDPGDVLGTATITAIARYPHQPVTIPDVPGDEAVTKTVTSLFSKSISCVRKTDEMTEAVWICTATAIGIDGTPFAGETVCFYAPVGGIFRSFPGFPFVPHPDFGTALPNVACVVTNSDGQAIIEIIAKGQFNVEAEFMDEHIFRRIDIVGSPLSGTTGGNPGTGVGGAGGTPTPPASPPPAAGVPPSLGGTGTVNKPNVARPSVQARVMSAKLVNTKSGRKLTLRVKSAKKTAKVRIVLKNRKGKVLATAVRTVRTNRVVTVPNLRIVRSAVRISVSVLR